MSITSFYTSEHIFTTDQLTIYLYYKHKVFLITTLYILKYGLMSKPLSYQLLHM